jgi:hypothetical protein
VTEKLLTKEMVYDKDCSMSQDGFAFKGNSTDPTIVALIAVEGSGMSIGALLLAVTIGHIVLFNNLSDKFVNIQLQVSSVRDDR